MENVAFIKIKGPGSSQVYRNEKLKFMGVWRGLTAREIRTWNYRLVCTYVSKTRIVQVIIVQRVKGLQTVLTKCLAHELYYFKFLKCTFLDPYGGEKGAKVRELSTWSMCDTDFIPKSVEYFWACLAHELLLLVGGTTKSFSLGRQNFTHYSNLKLE